MTILEVSYGERFKLGVITNSYCLTFFQLPICKAWQVCGDGVSKGWGGESIDTHVFCQWLKIKSGYGRESKGEN